MNNFLHDFLQARKITTKSNLAAAELKHMNSASNENANDLKKELLIESIDQYLTNNNSHKTVIEQISPYEITVKSNIYILSEQDVNSLLKHV